MTDRPVACSRWLASSSTCISNTPWLICGENPNHWSQTSNCASPYCGENRNGWGWRATVLRLVLSGNPNCQIGVSNCRLIVPGLKWLIRSRTACSYSGLPWIVSTWSPMIQVGWATASWVPASRDFSHLYMQWLGTPILLAYLSGHFFLGAPKIQCGGTVYVNEPASTCGPDSQVRWAADHLAWCVGFEVLWIVSSCSHICPIVCTYIANFASTYWYVRWLIPTCKASTQAKWTIPSISVW